MKKILVVTDIDSNIDYIRALGKEFDVESVGSVELALYKISLNPNVYRLAVVEMCLPTPKAFSITETDHDLKTGLVFYRKKLKELGIPTILWACPDFAEEVHEYDTNDKRSVVFVKREAEDDHLLRAINSLFPELAQELTQV